MAALKSDYLRSILLRASIWKPLGSRAPLASLAALARSLRSPHTGAASILEDLGSLLGSLGNDLLEVVSNGVVLFLTVSVLLPKMIQKSTPKLPKSSPKPSRIHPKTSQNPPKNAPKTRSGGDCASDRFWAFFSLGSVGVLGRLGRLLGPSWSRLGASGGVLEPSWHDLGAVLGRPWGVLGRLGASWGRLGSVLGHLGSVSGQFPRRSSIFYRFLLPTSMPET